MSEEVVSTESVEAPTSNEPSGNETPAVEDSSLESENVEVGAEPTEVENSESSDVEPMFDIVVDGVTHSVTQSEALEWAQKGRSSHAKFQEAAKLRKEAAAEKAAVQAALSGDLDDLVELGIKAGLRKPEDIQNWILNKAKAILEEPELTPEQQKIREQEKKLKAYEAAEKQKADEEAQATFQREVEQHQEKFSSEIVNAIKSKGLNNDPFTVQRVAQALLDTMDENGVIHSSVDDAIAFVKQSENNSFDNYISGLGLEDLERLVGADKMSELRKRDLSKIKNPGVEKKEELTNQEVRDVKKKISASDFFANLGK